LDSQVSDAGKQGETGIHQLSLWQDLSMGYRSRTFTVYLQSV
jgi:hypothetical protein